MLHSTGHLEIAGSRPITQKTESRFRLHHKDSGTGDTREQLTTDLETIFRALKRIKTLCWITEAREHGSDHAPKYPQRLWTAFRQGVLPSLEALELGLTNRSPSWDPKVARPPMPNLRRVKITFHRFDGLRDSLETLLSKAPNLEDLSLMYTSRCSVATRGVSFPLRGDYPSLRRVEIREDSRGRGDMIKDDFFLRHQNIQTLTLNSMVPFSFPPWSKVERWSASQSQKPRFATTLVCYSITSPHSFSSTLMVSATRKSPQSKGLSPTLRCLEIRQREEADESDDRRVTEIIEAAPWLEELAVTEGWVSSLGGTWDLINSVLPAAIDPATTTHSKLSALRLGINMVADSKMVLPARLRENLGPVPGDLKYLQLEVQDGPYMLCHIITEDGQGRVGSVDIRDAEARWEDRSVLRYEERRGLRNI
ncbi:hypothetical protein MVEN_00002600 [Mycena venus]|uniref:F-box domain-containing protein n=1 Tax=Mycena venus TaxID=2733690 RepID=A0A8H6Z959_9AGAR|nr:hypothetical protein MVEN_00002600 [Mycena venus]